MKNSSKIQLLPDNDSQYESPIMTFIEEGFELERLVDSNSQQLDQNQLQCENCSLKIKQVKSEEKPEELCFPCYKNIYKKQQLVGEQKLKNKSNNILLDQLVLPNLTENEKQKLLIKCKEITMDHQKNQQQNTENNSQNHQSQIPTQTSLENIIDTKQQNLQQIQISPLINSENQDNPNANHIFSSQSLQLQNQKNVSNNIQNQIQETQLFNLENQDSRDEIKDFLHRVSSTNANQQQLQQQQQQQEYLEQSGFLNSIQQLESQNNNSSLSDQNQHVQALRKKVEKISRNQLTQNSQLEQVLQRLQLEEQKNTQLNLKVQQLNNQMQVMVQVINNLQGIINSNQSFLQHIQPQPQQPQANNLSGYPNNPNNNFSIQFQQQQNIPQFGLQNSQNTTTTTINNNIQPLLQQMNNLDLKQQDFQQQQQQQPFLQKNNSIKTKNMQNQQLQQNQNIVFQFQNDSQDTSKGKIKYLTCENNQKAISSVSSKVMAFSAYPLLQTCNIQIENMNEHQLIIGVMVCNNNEEHKIKNSGYNSGGTLVYQENGELVVNNKGFWEQVAIVPTFKEQDIISFVPCEGRVNIFKNQAQVAYWKYNQSYNVLKPFVEFTIHQQSVKFV